MANAEEDRRAAIERALRQRMMSGEPWTAGTLSAVAERMDGTFRDADRYLQMWRRKGWAEFRRDGRNVIWTVTDAGRTYNTPLSTGKAEEEVAAGSAGK